MQDWVYTMNIRLPRAFETWHRAGDRRGIAALAVMLLLLAVMSLPQMAAAQTYRFSSVTIEGNQRIEPATILSYAGIARGETVSAGKLNDAYQKILGSGLFESAEIVPQGSNLLIRVKEYATINKVAFEGNNKIKDEALAEFVKTKPRQVLNPAQVERDVQIITEAYTENGRVSARVSPKVIQRSDNRVDLVFEIFEGKGIEVNRISFVGNKYYSDGRLRRVISSKQAGLLRAIIGRDTFVENRVQTDKQLLSDFYQSRGFVDFRVTGSNADLARERDAYFVTFNIQEGQQFRFGRISTVSEIAGVNAQDYQNVLKIRSGKIYSPTHVENSIARMERLAIKQGVDFLRVEPRITRNDRNLTLDVQFALTRGEKIFVERIDIEGNTTTLDRVIRRKFDVVEGDPFNARQIRETAERIRALNFFEDVQVDAREGSRPDQVIVDVDVEEKPTGSVSIGASYSTDSGMGLQLGFNERNFMGRGQSLEAMVSAGEDTSSYTLNFTEPAFLGRDVAFGLDLSYHRTDSDYTLFDTEIGTFRPSLNFPITEFSRLGLFYHFGYEDMTDYSGTSTILADEVSQGAKYLSAFGYDFSYDTRRGGLNPNAGVLLSFGQEFAGAGGDLEFVKTSARIVAQTKVWHEEVTLRASLEGGALNFLGSDDSRYINRYNSKVIRGFEPNGIGPIEGDEHLGGNYFAALKFETEFPLGLPAEYGLTGGAFYDIGSIWGIDANGAAVASRGFKARHSAGFSLFWESPFGPLRMNFAWPIVDEPGDDDQFFDLTVKTEF